MLQIKRKNEYLKSRRNMTIEDFNAILKKQNHKCGVCETLTPGKRGWCVDHSHRTNQIRGILCGHCNSLIGFARESTQTLIFAAEYLKHHHSLEYPPRE